MDLTRDLLDFVAAAPSPYHAVAEMARRLAAAGYRRLDERDRWTVQAGDRRYVVRDGGSIVAFRAGSGAPAEAGFRLVGAHTDSPTFVVRPVADAQRAGYRLAGVEVYGSVLYHTWFDRDLTLAGRAAVRDGAGGIATRLVHLPGAPLRIPSLAIHLDRDIRTQGFNPNPQQHLVPVWSHDAGPTADGLQAVVAEHLGVGPDDVLGSDLVTADTQAPAMGGRDDAWVVAPRLDNLASCHAALHALLAADAAPATHVIVANHHEEVGSGSAEGARGSFLSDVLRRIVAACGDTDPQAFAVAVSRSLLVSSDMAHAVHPNYAERHEGEHRPRLGGGPVLKVNAGQAYATDAPTAAWFASCCAEAGVGLQRFVTRGDLPCGSTIGPLTATRLGVATVDVGNPMLAMHSCREQAAAADVGPMIAALQVHLSAEAPTP